MYYLLGTYLLIINVNNNLSLYIDKYSMGGDVVDMPHVNFQMVLKGS